jgi:hypothetical protein
MEYKSCFILMPFTKTSDLETDDLDFIYTHILKKGVEDFEVDGEKYYQIVERYSSKVGSIINGVVNNLNTADLVIADLTGLNPNVMYELGVRHSLKRGTIIISQDLSNLPSDLRDYLTVEYKYSKRTTEQAKNFEIFKTELSKTINEVISTNKYDSPVLNYLQQRQQFRNEDAIDKLKKNVIGAGILLSEYSEIEDLLSTIIEDRIAINNEPLFFQLFNLKISNFLTSINELEISESLILNRNIIYVKSLLTEVNKIFSMSELMSGLMKIEGMPEAFGVSDLRGCLNRSFPDPFYLFKNKSIRFVSIKDIFEKDGVLKSEFLNNLMEYIENKAKDLGIERQELDTLLHS